MNELVVQVEGLTKVFGSFVAVDRVSFSIHRGEIFALLGSNGAGKTTTIRMLCGLIPPTAGHAWVLGLDASQQARALRQHIGYMSQRFSLYTDLTVEENLRFWGRAYGLAGGPLRQRAGWGLKLAGMEAYRSALVRNLPLGFRQRLALAVTLLHQPELVFLDEPTSGVDPEARRQFWQTIDGLAQSGTTVLVTTHALDEAERCHRVAFMHRGKLLAVDTVAGLKGRVPKDRLFRLTVADPSRALEFLVRQEEVEEVALFGQALHVLLAGPQSVPSVAQRMEHAGLGGGSWQPQPASLEDAFIVLMRQADRQGVA